MLALRPQLASASGLQSASRASALGFPAMASPRTGNALVSPPVSITVCQTHEAVGWELRAGRPRPPPRLAAAASPLQPPCRRAAAAPAAHPICSASLSLGGSASSPPQVEYELDGESCAVAQLRTTAEADVVHDALAGGLPPSSWGGQLSWDANSSLADSPSLFHLLRKPHERQPPPRSSALQ